MRNLLQIKYIIASGLLMLVPILMSGSPGELLPSAKKEIIVSPPAPPTAVCKNITVVLDASGNASIVANDVDGGSTYPDGLDDISVTPSVFTCANVGANNVALTVLDLNGIEDVCVAVVTVVDNINPVAVCKNITVQLDGTGNASITGSDIDNGSSDVCGIASLVASPSSFTCANVGSNTVTLTVTDNNGNVSTCTSTVIVEDNVNPVANCNNLTVQLDGAGNASITANDVNNGSSDACGIASLAVSPSSFTCANVGSNPVTLTVTDIHGNVSTCTSTITVQDNINPTASCKNITLQLDGAGNATISGADINNGSSDNCGIATLVASPNSFTCSNVGANTVTLTVTDNSGNTSICTSTVTVQDTVSPTTICKNITVQLDASGNAIITETDIDNGTNDACGLVSMIPTPSTFNCTNIGPNVVVLTALDNNGNTSTCNSTVTIEDNVPPVAICQNLTVQLNTAGNVSITANDVDNGSNDACGIASLAIDKSSFSCSNVGANTVTLTVTDNNGNISTCSSTVTVQDNIAPVANCKNITVQLDASGSVTILGANVNDGSTDACGIASLAVSPSTFTCANIGTNPVTLTVTDNNGNVSTCSSTVTVEDNVAPTAICKNITVQLDVSGNASITATDVDNGSTDACGIASLTINKSSFGCGDVGANTVTLTVTDIHGNSSTCTSTVTVEDNVLPTAICKNITVQLDATGNTSITANDVDNGSTDACGIASLAVSPSTFTCANIGGNTVTLTVTDNNGNISTCTSTVTVEDNVSPLAICKNITVQLDATGNASITATDVDNGSTDACGIASLTINKSSFGCGDVGANTVTLTVTDANANVSQCTTTVNIQDNILPTAICKNITVQLDASGNVSISGSDVDNGSTDACGIASLAVSPSSFSCGDIGANTVTLTVTDNNGNVSTCTSTVTVEDNVPPVAVCKNITVQLDASGNVTITPNDINDGSSDACGIASSAITTTAFTCADIGNNFVVLTLTDNNGNVSTCVSTVTVEDNVAPVASCKDITVQLDASGNATIVAADVDDNSTDACGIVGRSVTPSSFSCANIGANTVTLTLVDGNGNLSTCTSTVTVEDNVAPTAICKNITVQLNALGNTSITANDIDNGSNDACGIASLTVSPSSFTCVNVGGNTVTLTVTDIHGNVSTCTSTVTVEDNVAPVANCKNITVQLDASGNVSITGADVDNSSTDACGIVSLAVSPSSFTCSNVGANTVTLTVTDVNGNVSTCTSTVTVEDNVAPVATCKDITVQLDASGNVSIIGADVNNNSTDICGIASLAVSPSSFTCGDVGPNTVTLTVTDVNGNTSTCTSTVTVEDNVDPVAICKNITVQLDASGNASISGADIDNGSNDACGVTSLTVSPNTFTCSEEGLNTVTLTVTDVNGNISTCTSTVTVEDNVAPVANCKNITVQLDASGNVSITGADVDNNSTDACGIASLTVSPSTFTCANIGGNTVTLTVTDNNGNISTCTSTVTVEDNVAPVANCKDITVQLDASGNAIIVAADVNNNSTDACGIASLAINKTSFACGDVGSNTVTLTVTDVNGNTSTCTSTVTVEDNVAPVAICKNIIVQLDASGNASINGADIDSGSNDVCGIASLAVSPNTFTCSEEGLNTVTLTVTDVNGNTSTCISTVTVEDNVAPIANCKNITVQLDASGNASITGADVDNNSTDACGIASLAVSPSTFTCVNIGGNTVTLTVTDVNGNTSTCTSTVTIEDKVPPVLTFCPADINENVTPLNCGRIVNYSLPTFTDNCSIATMAQTDGTGFSSGSIFPVGVTTQEYTITDGSGNTTICKFSVTIVDDEVPVITGCPSDISMSATACGATPTWTPPLASDNCPGVTLTSSHLPGDLFPSGTTQVTYTATDAVGNVTLCQFNVVITENVAPVANCKNITVQLDGTGNVSITGADVDNGSTDNCGLGSITVSPNTFTCAELGANSVVLTVTDLAGNSSTCNATVTVEDNIKPIPSNPTLADVTGGCIVSSLTDPLVTDNCSGTITITNDAVLPITTPGTTVVTWTYDDGNGNTETQTQNVVINDNTGPVPDLAVLPDVTAECELTSLTVIPTATDACSGTVTVTNDATLPIIGQGTTVVTWTYDDGKGNTSTQTQNVVINDITAPTPDASVLLTVSGECEVTSLVAPTATDNCGGIVTVTNDAVLPITTQGTTVVTWTYDDGNGNTSTQTQNVVIDDITAPVPTATTLPTITSECSISGIIAPTAIDNCGGLMVATSNASFPITGQGTTTVTWTFDDGNGNTSTITQDVILTDVSVPVATVANLPDVTSECSITSLTPPTAIDNCAGLLAGTHNVTLPIDTQGTTVVTWTYDDGNGNTSTQTQKIIIADTTAPVVSVLADVTSGCDVTSLVDPAVTDNCSSTIIITSDAVLPITTPGITLVTWTFDDGNGNISTQTQNVIIDSIDITTTVTGNGQTITVNNTSALGYQWINCSDSSEIAGETNQSFTATTNGSYAVIVSEGTCRDTSDCVDITNVGVDENNVLTNVISIYPNPTKNQITISFEATIDDSYMVSVRNSIGQIVKELKPTEQTINVDLSAWDKGIYFVHIINSEGFKIEKVIKQ